MMNLMLFSSFVVKCFRFMLLITSNVWAALDENIKL